MLAVTLSSGHSQSQKNKQELTSGLKNILKGMEVLSAQELKNQTFGSENHDLIFLPHIFSHPSSGSEGGKKVEKTTKLNRPSSCKLTLSSVKTWRLFHDICYQACPSNDDLFLSGKCNSKSTVISEYGQPHRQKPIQHHIRVIKQNSSSNEYFLYLHLIHTVLNLEK